MKIINYLNVFISLVSLSVHGAEEGINLNDLMNPNRMKGLTYYAQSPAVEDGKGTKTLFDATSSVNANICSPISLEKPIPESAKSNIEEFLDYTCQSENSLKDQVSYCECINRKEYRISGRTNAGRISMIKARQEEVYSAELAEIVSEALVSYLSESQKVGYALLTNSQARDNLKDAGCKPGNFQAMLEKASNESVKGKSCLEKLNHSKFMNLLGNKINENKFSHLKIGVDSSINGINDLAFLVDTRVSDSFKRGTDKIYERSIPLLQFNPLNYDNFPKEDFEKISQQESQKIASLYELSQKIANNEIITDELYKRVQDAYLTSPLVRGIKRSLNLELSNSVSKSLPSILLSNRISANNETGYLDKNELKKIATGVIARLNEGRKEHALEKPIENVEEFLETHNRGLVNYATKINTKCEESFKKIQDHCDKTEEEVFSKTPHEELGVIVGEVQSSEDTLPIENAKNDQIITGALQCHMKSCSNKDGNISKECIEKSYAAVLNGKKVEISKSLSQFESSERPIREYDKVVDAEINLGDLFESKSSGRSIASTSPVSDTFNANAGASAYDEPMIDSSIDTSFVNSVGNFPDNNLGINPTGSIYNAENVVGSTLGSSDISVMDNDNSFEEVTQNNPRVQNSVDSKATDELRKELESIKKELASSKDERDSTKKELEDFKTQKVLEDQQRAMAEKEKAMRDNLNGLEEKIRKLENEKVNIAQQIPTKFSNPRVSSDSFTSGQGVGTSSISDFSAQGNSVRAPSAFNGQKNVISNSSGAKSAFSGVRSSSAVGAIGQSVISLSSKNDPSLGAKVREAYQNGVETLYVTIGGNYYRVTPKKDNSGNLILENGEVALNFEITTTEIAENATSQKLPEGLLRTPAAVDEEAFVGPTINEEEALRYSDLLSKLRDAK